MTVTRTVDARDGVFAGGMTTRFYADVVMFLTS